MLKSWTTCFLRVQKDKIYYTECIVGKYLIKRFVWIFLALKFYLNITGWGQIKVRDVTTESNRLLDKDYTKLAVSTPFPG